LFPVEAEAIKDLRTQSKNAANQNIIAPFAHGTIANDQFETSRGLTFATVQKLYRYDLTSLKDNWDVINAG